MWEHLELGEPPPQELIRHVFYERYGWTYQELRDTPLSEILSMLTVMDVEARYQKRKNPAKANAA